ncbi:DUF7674 family protein [Elizabethkingia miricola]|uniref:DUF7674 domain-containing protein n=1 Tax=Elizabethkingia miricola TaxID=172045 RepID=A0ABD5B2W6_ELIMR|nr:hypothetical protein [Elizabethkingia miricola]MDQ8747448.1 hypothetical protein [Elizabethkingia miricola]OPB85559.1 hypothetical protein BAS06_18995 [Elizabethkingia miricola]
MMNDKMQTINKKIATEYLKISYPSIRNEITQLSAQNNFAGIMQAVINYLKILLQEAKINMISYHIKSMEWLYRNGNNYIKYIIESLFVRSFESMKRISEDQHWDKLYEYMPVRFQEIYLEQIRKDEIIIQKK